MFEHLDDTTACAAPPVAQVRHRARQIVASRRRNRVAVGSAALAVSGVAGMSVIAQRPTTSTLAPASPAEAPVEKPTADAPIDRPAEQKSPGANVAEPATGPSKPPGKDEPQDYKKALAPASAAFVAECEAAHDAASPTYVPAGFRELADQPLVRGSVNLPALGYTNADNTTTFSVQVICNEGGIAPDQLTLNGKEATTVTVEDVAIGDHTAKLATANDGLYVRASWLIDDQIMIEVMSKGSLTPKHTRLTEAELLKVARSIPAN